MRYFEFKYLTKGLPLILKSDVVYNDYNGMYVEREENEKENENDELSLSKGETVYFCDVEEGNYISVKLLNKKENYISLASHLLEIDYKYVGFPYYEELVNIFEEEHYITTLKEGMKLVTTEDEGRFYCEHLGGGQIVKIISLSFKDNDLYEIVVEDQFGNIYENQFQFYLYDETKLNQDPKYIINPYDRFTDNDVLEIKLTKSDIQKFSEILSSKLREEHEDVPWLGKATELAFIDAYVEWKEKNK